MFDGILPGDQTVFGATNSLLRNLLQKTINISQLFQSGAKKNNKALPRRNVLKGDRCIMKTEGNICV